MTKRIVITGRGGTGKTTFAALAARLLPSPKLLIDADPDAHLAAVLGVDLQARGVRTISEALLELHGRKGSGKLEALPLAERVEYVLHLSCLYESAEFDLLSLGVKWTRGCYCAANDTLRTLIPRIAQNYAFSIMDSPAGVEHVNRQVFHEVDDVFAIMDPSSKSLRNTLTFRDMASSIGFHYENLFIVANHRFVGADGARLRAVPGATFLGRIEQDPAVERCEWEDTSLLALPDNSPACVSIRGILQKAGYPVQ